MNPQQKKQLSYAKDRRNTYGENSKSSRKNISRSKALDIRAERHAQDSALACTRSVIDADALDAMDNAVRSTKPRQWRKSPDEALGQVLAVRRQHLVNKKA